MAYHRTNCKFPCCINIFSAGSNGSGDSDKWLEHQAQEAHSSDTSDAGSPPDEHTQWLVALSQTDPDAFEEYMKQQALAQSKGYKQSSGPGTSRLIGEAPISPVGEAHAGGRPHHQARRRQGAAARARAPVGDAASTVGVAALHGGMPVVEREQQVPAGTAAA